MLSAGLTGFRRGFPWPTECSPPCSAASSSRTSLPVSDQDRSREYYRSVFGATVVLEREPVILKLASSWLILNMGGGPADDKPTVTLAPPADPGRASPFLNIRPHRPGFGRRDRSRLPARSCPVQQLVADAPALRDTRRLAGHIHRRSPSIRDARRVTGQGTATLTKHTSDGENPIDLPTDSSYQAMIDHVLACLTGQADNLVEPASTLPTRELIPEAHRRLTQPH